MKHLLVLLLLLCSTSVFAQDVIVKKDGSTILCRVVELTSSEIVYKKWSNLKGSNYVMNRTDASAINYQDGKKVNLSEATNLYTPNNQNDGVQQYNDRALLALDAANRKTSHSPTSTIIRIVGWGIGATAVGTGVYFLAFAKGHDHYKGLGLGIAVGGVACTAGCLLLANYLDKRERSIETTSIFQHEFNLTNSSTLSAGIDMLNDRIMGSNAIGLGLRYNF